MRLVSRVFSGMLNRPPKVPRVAEVPPQSTIPRLIHQVFFPARPLPPELQANVDSLRSLNPTWRHTLWDDVAMERFIRTSYGDAVWASFDRIAPAYGAARADLFRYLLLYRQGGLYLDIKSAATLPLDSVVRADDRYLIGQWPVGPDVKFQGAGWHDETAHVGGEFQQWFVLAAPGHPFLKAVIENVLQNIEVYNPALHGVAQRGVLRLTGPIAYTLAIAPLLDQHPHRRVDAERDLGFEYSIYPTVDKGAHRHFSLFKVHYSQSRESVVRLDGPRGAVIGRVLALENLILKGRNRLTRRG